MSPGIARANAITAAIPIAMKGDAWVRPSRPAQLGIWRLVART